jgi:hypothetical protein
MNTYICFNDESGSLEDKNSKYYVRVSLIVNIEYLKEIRNKIYQTRNKYNLLEIKEEIKWQYLWQLRKFFKSNKDHNEIKDRKLKTIYVYLKGIQKDYSNLLTYCYELLEGILVNKNNHDVRIVLSFTDKGKYYNYKDKDIYRFHIQDHLQRLQMQYQKADNLVIIIYDYNNEQKNKLFKEIYNDILCKGDFIKNYSVIYDSLLFDDSGFNAGLQIADYIAGCYVNTLTAIKNNNIDNYSFALNCFKNLVYPNLCKQSNDEIWGAGLLECPTDKGIRDEYKKKINLTLKQIKQANFD